MKYLKDWLWKYPKINGNKCPRNCEVKIVAQSACDKLAECKHGYWQINCVPTVVTLNVAIPDNGWRCAVCFDIKLVPDLVVKLTNEPK